MKLSKLLQLNLSYLFRWKFFWLKINNFYFKLIKIYVRFIIAIFKCIKKKKMKLMINKWSKYENHYHFAKK